MKALLVIALAATPIDTILDYDGQVIELPASICRALDPISYTAAGLAMPAIVCRDQLFSDGFEVQHD